MEAAVTALFDEATNTVSYIVADRQRPRLRSSIACWISTRNPRGPRHVRRDPAILSSLARAGVRAAVPSKSASLRPNTLSMVWTNQSYRKWSKSHLKTARRSSPHKARKNLAIDRDDLTLAF